MKLISKRPLTEKIEPYINAVEARRFKAYLKLIKKRPDLHIPLIEELEKFLVKTMDRLDREIKEIDGAEGADGARTEEVSS